MTNLNCSACLPAQEMIDVYTLRALACGTEMTFGELRSLVSSGAYDFVANAKALDQADEESGTEDAVPEWQDAEQVLGAEDAEMMSERMLDAPTAQQIMADMPEFDSLGTVDASPSNGAFCIIPADQEQAFLEKMKDQEIHVVRNDEAAQLARSTYAPELNQLLDVARQVRAQTSAV